MSSKSKKPSSKDEKNHKQHKHIEYEFFGPYIGPIALIIGLPIIVFLYARYCDSTGWPIKNFSLS